jgi:hypothetical protein
MPLLQFPLLHEALDEQAHLSSVPISSAADTLDAAVIKKMAEMVINKKKLLLSTILFFIFLLDIFKRICFQITCAQEDSTVYPGISDKKQSI